jgi:hypothetical protein
MKALSLCAGVTGLALLLMPAAVKGQKEKVFRILSTEHLERILKEAEIDFKKVPPREEGVIFYDYERGGYKLRLHNYAGRDLWLEAIFPTVPLETLNRWNQRSKFSRAVLVKEEESTSLEVQLDCTGGVTDGMLRRFLRRFDDDVRAFAKFIKQ